MRGAERSDSSRWGGDSGCSACEEHLLQPQEGLIRIRASFCLPFRADLEGAAVFVVDAFWQLVAHVEGMEVPLEVC